MLAILLLLGGVLCCSTSVLFLKASAFHPSEVAAFRLLLASVLLSPLFFLNLKKYRDEFAPRDVRLSVLPAITLALHFISWAQGAKMTHAANATLIVNMVPVVVPLLLFLTEREIITSREMVGTVISLAGVGWIASADFSVDRQSLLGDIVCFGSMLLFSYYLVQGRVSRKIPSIWLYVVPLYAFAGLVCFVVALFMAHPLTLHPPRDYLVVLGLAFVPTILGHSILNLSMKKLSGQIVSVCNLMQFLFAGILAYLLFGEAPRPTFYPAGALVVAGAVIVILAVAATAKGKIELKESAAAEV
jgi:drug/metabolite transporter (DMT)-like permease